MVWTMVITYAGYHARKPSTGKIISDATAQHFAPSVPLWDIIGKNEIKILKNSTNSKQMMTEWPMESDTTKLTREYRLTPYTS